MDGEDPNPIGAAGGTVLDSHRAAPHLGAGARVDGAGPGSLILKAHISMLCWPILEARLKGT